MKLSICTYNVAMLPPPQGFSKRNRAREIGRQLLELSPDVICLQEVFDEGIREGFTSRLKKAGYAVHAKSDGGGFLQEDSGLFFATKHHIVGTHFEEFTTASAIDGLAEKGVFAALLRVVDGSTESLVAVCNTHLQSERSNAHIRSKQFWQIRRFINRIGKSVADPSSLAMVLVGDLNVIGEDAEYHTMIESLGYPEDLHVRCNPDDPGYTWYGPGNTYIAKYNTDHYQDTDTLRLDYALAFHRMPIGDVFTDNPKLKTVTAQAARTLMFSDNTNGNDLSDHYGIEVHLTI